VTRRTAPARLFGGALAGFATFALFGVTAVLLIFGVILGLKMAFLHQNGPERHLKSDVELKRDLIFGG